MERIHNLRELRDRRRALRKQATPQEKRLWQYLRNRNIGYKFRRQHSIGFYIADFYCSEKKLIIEVDGPQHYSEDGKEYDEQREFVFQNMKFRIMRITNEEINKNISLVIESIKSELEKPLSW